MYRRKQSINTTFSKATKKYLRNDSFDSSKASIDERSVQKYGDRVFTSDLLNKKDSSIRIFSSKKKALRPWDGNSNLSPTMFKYDDSRILDRGDNYKVIHSLKKNSRRYKLTKVIDKSKGFNRKELSKELAMHESLSSSLTLLKLEEVIETDKQVFLFYEDGEIMNKGQIFSMVVKSDFRMLFSSIAIALCEINSLGLAVGLLEAKNVVKIGSDSNPVYKLFNFGNLTKYGERVKETYNRDAKVNMNKLKDYKANPRLDSRALGIFMAKSLKMMAYSLNGHPFNTQYLKNLMEDHGLDHDEKDLISGLTAVNYDKRLILQDVLLHSYFLDIIIKSYKLQKQITATFSYIKTIDFEHLKSKILSEKKALERDPQNKRLRTLANIRGNRGASQFASVGKISKRGSMIKTPKGSGNFNFNRRRGRNNFGQSKNLKSFKGIVEEEKEHSPDKDKSRSRRRLPGKRHIGYPKRKKKQGFFAKILGGFGCCGER